MDAVNEDFTHNAGVDHREPIPPVGSRWMFPMVRCDRGDHDWRPLRMVVTRGGHMEDFPAYRVIGEKCTGCGMQRGMMPDRERALHDAAKRCRETPGDVMPEPGARYRSPWSRELMDRNAERARDGR
jgi:hypothetical protein